MGFFNWFGKKNKNNNNWTVSYDQQQTSISINKIFMVFGGTNNIKKIFYNKPNKITFCVNDMQTVKIIKLREIKNIENMFVSYEKKRVTLILTFNINKLLEQLHSFFSNSIIFEQKNDNSEE